MLSLPLAFILSQDQTLRCIENFNIYPRTSGCTSFSHSFHNPYSGSSGKLEPCDSCIPSFPKISQKPSFSLLTFFSISFNELVLSFPYLAFLISEIRPERECKCKAFFYPKQTFLKVFSKKLSLFPGTLIPCYLLLQYFDRNSV